MNTDVYHDTTWMPVPAAGTIVTLGEIREAIDASDSIPAARKRHLIWALNRTIGLIGHGVADVRADPKTVLRQLEHLSPAMTGLSPRAFANLKSLIRTAFRLFASRLAPARSKIKLKGRWAALEALLPLRLKRNLSRFMRFAQAMGWAPHEIGDEHMERFGDYLKHEAMLDKADGVLRATRYGWNAAVDTVAGWPVRRVIPPPSKRTPYWLGLDELPASLQQTLEAYLHRLGHPDPFVGPGSRILRPGTVVQYRNMLVMLASALVRSGVPVEQLTSIAVLVRPDHVKKALEFMYERAGRKVSSYVHVVAYRARHVAAHVGLPEEDRARLDEILAWVNRARPIRRGLADKNRKLLEHLDDPDFVHRLLTLPSRLMAAVRRMTASSRAMSLARDAVAIEILLTCSMRVGNLVDLRLGETMRKFGEGADAQWVIDLPAEKVKNAQPMRYTLPSESGRLIEEYLAQWQHRWCGHGVPWLLPERHGGHVDRKVLSESIAKRARRYVGVRITAHQHRHVCAELVLREDPNAIAIVSQHLGHRDLTTTRRFYAREQTRIATARYHEVLVKARSAAPPRRRRSRKPKSKPA
jgi:integrase